MGADLITTAYTMTSKEIAAEEAAVIFAEYLEAVREKISLIDQNELLYGRDLDERGFDEDGVDGLLDVLIAGFAAHSDNWRYSNQYPIPRVSKEDPSFYFTVAGGTSWGDDPFEGFSELCLLVTATDEVRELGQAIGILGSGIVLPDRKFY